MVIIKHKQSFFLIARVLLGTPLLVSVVIPTQCYLPSQQYVFYLAIDNCLQSVSYTHLDVYKRQGYRGALSEFVYVMCERGRVR